MSVSRRALFSTTAAVAAMPVANTLARQEATPATGSGKRTVFHAARITGDLPAGMTRVYPDQDVYEDVESDLHIAAGPIPDMTLEEIVNVTKLNSDVIDYELNGTPGRLIEDTLGLVSGKSGSVLFVEYPEPIPYLSTQASVLSLELSPELVDSFLPTVSLDMSQVTGPEYINEVLLFSEDNSLVSEDVDWEALRATAESEVTSIDDAHTFLQEDLISTLESVGDTHSRVFSPGYLTGEQATPVASPEATPEPIDMPEAEVLEDGTLYLRIPLIVDGDIQEYVDICNEALAQHAETVGCNGVIVDLRQNRGGIIYAMIAALAPLLPKGNIYGYKYPKFEDPDYWSKSGAVRFLKQAAGVTNNDFDYTSAPVAVLMGPGTASSAELTAISFIGRPNSQSFGMETGGYTSAPNSYPLLDGWIVNLTASVMTDSEGTPYGGSLLPDSEVTYTEDQIRTPDDPVIAAAQDWLQQTCASGTGTPEATPVD